MIFVLYKIDLIIYNMNIVKRFTKTKIDKIFCFFGGLMKLRKLILPALLTLGLAGGLVFSHEMTNNPEVRVSAMADYTCDPEIDVGINIKSNSNSSTTDFPIVSFYVNQFDSVDVSGGDYLAFRLRSNNAAGSYFDVIPNVAGNASRVPINPKVTGIKCIPAGPSGTAFDYQGARPQDLPLNMWANADIWFCIPKAQFSRIYFGSGIDWSKNLAAVYFLFYGTTIDKIDFDLGNLYTANIDEGGHLVKVNRILNWANASMSTGVHVDANGNQDTLTLTDNFSSLKPAVKFIQSLETVNSCSVTQQQYENLSTEYNKLDADCKDYLLDAIIADYADGDTGHEGGKYTGWTAQAKWEEVSKAAGHPLNTISPLFFDENKQSAITYICVVTGVLSLVGMFFFIRRKKLNK